MASLLAVTGGAIINALAFSGTNYAFHSLSGSEEERKRHDLAIEKYQRDHNAWIERRQAKLDAGAERLRRAEKSEKHLSETDMSMVEYAKAFDPEPQFYQYYHPSEDQKKKDYVFALATVVGVGAVAYYVL